MKRISDGGAYTRPFITHKGNNVQYVHMVGTSEINIDESTKLDPYTFNYNSADRNPSGLIKSLLGRSVENLFFSSGSNVFPLNVTAKKTDIELPFYVINIPQRMYGEQIKPGSISISSPSASLVFIDDVNSNLIISGTTSVVGNVFHKSGIILVRKSKEPPIELVPIIPPEDFFSNSYFDGGYFNAYFQSPSGLFTSSVSGTKATLDSDGLYLEPSSSIQINFNSTFTIYENSYICTVEPGEFNYSVNPTMNTPTLSGSFSGSDFIPSSGPKAITQLISGSLNPYFTQIGLYNDNYELLAIAKVPRAIRRLANTQQTVIVRFDV